MQQMKGMAEQALEEGSRTEQEVAVEEAAWGNCVESILGGREEPATMEELARQRQKQPVGSSSGQEWYTPSEGRLPSPWPKDSAEVQRRRAVLEEALLGLQALGQGRMPEDSKGTGSPEEWERQLREEIVDLADAEQFEAGGPHKAYWVWHYFFQRAGELMDEDLLRRKQVRWVLRLLRQGIRPDIVSATAECQFKNKRHESRLIRCSRELRELVGEDQLAAYLEGPELLPVQFPNSSKLEPGPRQLKGAEEFLAATRDTWLQQGVLEHAGDRRPQVVHRHTPETKKEKWRLCLDALYLNARSVAEQFR